MPSYQQGLFRLDEGTEGQDPLYTGSGPAGYPINLNHGL